MLFDSSCKINMSICREPISMPLAFKNVNAMPPMTLSTFFRVLNDADFPDLWHPKSRQTAHRIGDGAFEIFTSS